MNIPAKWVVSALCGVVFAFAPPVQAQALEFEFNAFGTLGVARSTIQSPAYAYKATSGWGLDSDWSTPLDSRLGLQGTLSLSRDFALIAQMIVRRDGSGEVREHVSWAQGRWNVDKHWELRFGRFRHNLFLITDTYDVGYSYPWVRPPAEFYSLVGESTSLDGILVAYRDMLWERNLRVTVHAGQSEISRQLYSSKTRSDVGFSVSLSGPHLKLQASLVQADVNFQSPRLNPVVALVAVQSPAIAAEYAPGNVSGQRYGALGFQYDNDGWLVMGEAARLQLRKKSFPDRFGWYVTVGRSFGALMPYATLAQTQMIGALREDRLTGAAARATNALLAGSNRNERAASLGMRWDVHPSVALKIQVDRVRPQVGAPGLFTAPIPAGREAVNLYSLALDWVY